MGYGAEETHGENEDEEAGDREGYQTGRSLRGESWEVQLWEEGLATWSRGPSTHEGPPCVEVGGDEGFQ